MAFLGENPWGKWANHGKMIGRMRQSAEKLWESTVYSTVHELETIGPVGLMIYLFKIVVFRSQSVKLPASILERTNFWGIMVRY